MAIPDILFQVKKVPTGFGEVVNIGDYLTLREVSELLEIQPVELRLTGFLAAEFELEGFEFATIKVPRAIDLD